MKIIICVLLLNLFALVYGNGTHDFDISVQSVHGENKAGTHDFSAWASQVSLHYYGNFKLSNNFGFLYNEEIDGVTDITSETPLPEITQPINARTGLGLEYRGLGLLQLKATNHAIHNSKELAFPVYFKTNNKYYPGTFVQRNKNNIDLFWNVPVWRFRVTANLMYNVLSYDYYRGLEGSSTRDVLNNLWDADFWGFGAIDYPFLNQALLVKGTILAKNDLNESSAYDVYKITAGMQGNFIFFHKKIRGTVEAYARYYQSTIMLHEYRDYADQLGFLLHGRAYYEIINRLYFKTDCAAELAPHKTYDSTVVVKTVNNIPVKDTIGTPVTVFYAKQRYELSLKRAFIDLSSSIEGGYWISFGGLVPRQCFFLTGTISVSPKFDIIPGYKSYLMWLNQSSRFSYVRSDIDLYFYYHMNSENHTFFRHFTLYCGGTLRLVRNLPSYVSNGRICVGISNYL